MPFIHLAQDPTPVSDAAVVEVVQQATEAIDAFSNLGVFMAVLFVIALLIIFFGAIVLVVVWSNRNSNNITLTTLAKVAADETKKSEVLIQSDLRYREQFLAALAVLSGKQSEISTGVTSSESRVTSQMVQSETNIKGRIATGAEANLASFEKLYKLVDMAFKIELARPPDPAAAARYDKAIEGLTAQMEAVKDDIKGVKSDAAANTDARVHTAEMSAVNVPTTDTPAEVIVTAVSPEAVDTIVSAMGAGAATEGGEGTEAA